MNVSSASSSASSLTATPTVFDVSPGAKVSVPLPAVKSAGGVADPPAVAHCTVTVFPLAPFSDTVKLAGTSPSTTPVSPIESAGAGSSSVIVPRPLPSPIVPPDGADSVTVNVSSASSRTSPLTSTVTVLLVSPAAKVTVPPPAVKSAGAVAVPTAVAQSTLTAPAAAWSSVTANCAWTVPAFPSSTVRSPIEICGGAAVTVNVCGADTPVLPALSDCSACAV